MTRIRLSVQKFLSALRSVHRGPLFSLFLAAGMLFTLMTFTACDCNNNGVDDCDTAGEQQYQARMISQISQLAKAVAPNTTAKIYGTHDVSATLSSGSPAAPGVLYRRFLWVNVVGAAPSAVNYTWRPPEGASNIVFTGRQPEPGWNPAQPVFTFRDVPPTEYIPINFALPATSPSGGDRVAESLVAQPSAGPATTAYLLTPLSGAVTAAPADISVLPSSAEAAASPAAPVFMWDIQRWYGRNISITTAQCQQAVDLLQSDATFVALQLPNRGHPGSESSLLPIYYTPTLELTNPTNGTTYLAGAGAFRTDRFTFAASELPPADGKIWVTLGAAQSPKLTCPAGLTTSDWEIHLDFLLDLSYTPDSCRGCTLDVFLCYEGQELPGSRLAQYVARQQVNQALEKLVRSADAQAGVRDYRDWGVTCAGPLPLQLVDDPNWSNWALVGASAQAITPTWPVTLPVTLEGAVPNPPQLFDLQFSSNLNAGWRWSDGQQVITPPISYSGGAPKTVYLAGQAPADTPTGMYTTQITASLSSQPANYRIAPHLIWVGEWLPPPQRDQGRKLYLPLVMK